MSAPEIQSGDAISRHRSREGEYLEKTKSASSGKSSSVEVGQTTQVAHDPEHGKLEELEVDIANVIEENEEYSVESDHSPYAEGMTCAPVFWSSSSSHKITNNCA